MKVLRVTITAVDIARQTEREFQLELTKRLARAGFRTDDPIIRQARSDIQATDLIQLRYGWWDRFDVKYQYFMWKIYKWYAVNIKK